jgi:hypothetical protein
MVDLPDEARGGQRQPAAAHASRCAIRYDGDHARAVGAIHFGHVARQLSVAMKRQSRYRRHLQRGRGPVRCRPVWRSLDIQKHQPLL